MSFIFENLPGIQLPISEISKQLGDMWKGEINSSSAAPSEFRASQLNLIIHMGLDTDLDEAELIFKQSIEFTQRHPGRIIILCPTLDNNRIASMQGKLFTQCYIGESQREMCCCEALLLEYNPDEPQSLFNQVTIWLENDLPVYYWCHRIPVKNIKNKHLSFVKNSKRVLFDSQIEEDDYLDIPIPEKWRLRDLADARMLPIKQSIGQILSTFEASDIINGLKTIEIHSEHSNLANANQLKSWLSLCLSESEGFSELKRKPEIIINDNTSDTKAIEVVFSYSNNQNFYWGLSNTCNGAETHATIAGRTSRNEPVLRQTDFISTLSEAIFFGR